MQKKGKQKAVKLLSEKVVTSDEMACETGHGSRQPRGTSKGMREEGARSVLTHGKSGSTPHDRLRAKEVTYLRKHENTYHNIAIARLGDTCIEDVPANPERAKDVERYGGHHPKRSPCQGWRGR